MTGSRTRATGIAAASRRLEWARGAARGLSRRRCDAGPLQRHQASLPLAAFYTGTYINQHAHAKASPHPRLRRYNQTYLERFDRFKKAGGLGRVDVEGVRRLLDKSGAQPDVQLTSLQFRRALHARRWTHTHAHTRTRTRARTRQPPTQSTAALPPKKDFIGASGYASTDVNVGPASHEVSAATVNFEFLSFGM